LIEKDERLLIAKTNRAANWQDAGYKSPSDCKIIIQTLNYKLLDKNAL